MTRIGPFLLMVLVLAGCSARGAFLPPAEGEVAVQQMFLVTNRASAGPFRFSESVSPGLRRMRYDVAIPSERGPGEIAYAPGAAGRFGIAGAAQFEDATAFYHALRQSGDRDDAVGIFVHGFNTNVPEALFRHTQIAADFDRLGPQVTFAWPSRASPTGYVADRDAANLSRDALAGFLMELSRSQDRPIVLVAHSMGAYLAMEALRQIALSGSDISAHLAAVVLISPDIDIEVFRTQFDVLEPKPEPLIVLASRSDRALRLSSRLAGQSERLGSPDDFDRLRALDVIVVDLSDVSAGDRSGHFSAVTSPEAIAMLQGLASSGLLGFGN